MNKDELYPNKSLKNICYIKNVVNGKNVIVSDYTYYNTTKDPHDFEKDCITYHYEFLKDKLIIGKFCSLGENVTILPGIHIGYVAIIGVNSVVSKNVKPYTVGCG